MCGTKDQTILAKVPNTSHVYILVLDKVLRFIRKNEKGWELTISSLDDLFHDVIEKSVQHVTLTDSTRHTSHGDESDASYDDGDEEGKKYAHYTEQEKWVILSLF